MDTELDTLLNWIVPTEIPAQRWYPGGPTWTDAEIAFLVEHAGHWPDARIAQALGRSQNAVKVRRVRMQLPSRRTHPEYLSTTRAARILGMDEHKLSGWVDDGLIAGERYVKQMIAPGPCAAGNITRRVRWITLKRWLTRPHNWIYFDATRIRDTALRALVLRAQARWGDEWWSATQVAEYHNVDVRWVNSKLVRGEIPYVQACNLSGRHPDSAWSFNFVKKSDALRARFISGRGGMQAIRAAQYTWSARADAFILRAAAEGLPWTEIGRMMRWRPAKVAYRFKLLQEVGR